MDRRPLFFKPLSNTDAIPFKKQFANIRGYYAEIHNIPYYVFPAAKRMWDATNQGANQGFHYVNHSKFRAPGNPSMNLMPAMLVNGSTYMTTGGVPKWERAGRTGFAPLDLPDASVNYSVIKHGTGTGESTFGTTEEIDANGNKWIYNSHIFPACRYITRFSAIITMECQSEADAATIPTISLEIGEQDNVGNTKGVTVPCNLYDFGVALESEGKWYKTYYLYSTDGSDSIVSVNLRTNVRKITTPHIMIDNSSTPKRFYCHEACFEVALIHVAD